MVSCYELFVVKRSRCWFRLPRTWLPDVKKRRNVNQYRESSHQQSSGSKWSKRRYLWHLHQLWLDMNPYPHRATSSSHPVRGQVLRDQCFFCLVDSFVEFCCSVGFGTTVDSGDSRDSVDFLVVDSSQTSGVWFVHASFVGLTRAHFSLSVEPESNTLSTFHECKFHILVRLSRSHFKPAPPRIDQTRPAPSRRLK